MLGRSWRVAALTVGVVLIATASGLLYLGMRDSAHRAEELDNSLNSVSGSSAVLMSEFFDRAVGSVTQLSIEPPFSGFYEKPGTLESRIHRNIPILQKAQTSLLALGRTYPGAVDEACFIDIKTGREIARVVGDQIAKPDDLSPDESKGPFFRPTVRQSVGMPYQSQPYVSGDSSQWVVGTATQIALHQKPVGLVHFEVNIESLRQALVAGGTDGIHIRVVDAGTGQVVIDGERYQVGDGDLGNPDDTTFAGQSLGEDQTVTLDNERLSMSPMPKGRTLDATNANNWVIAASAPAVQVGLMSAISPLVIVLFALGIPLTLVAVVGAWRARRRRLAEQVRIREERDRLDSRMEDLSYALAQAAAGDLSVTVDVDLGDARMTALAQGFDATLTHLRGLVAQVQASGDRLAESASELRATAAAQAAGASEQSTAVTETTATVEELAATAAQIADTATVVAGSARETLALTGEGLTAVHDSVMAIGRITDSVDSIALSSAALGEKVGEIGRILVLIDELSEQTNLLALNAAIEAARAGEHGRGFAVVAAEVRKLAERAQESTAQIQGLVTEISAYTQSTVLASEVGSREAGRGVEVAGAASTALDRIAEMVDSTTSAVAEISVATQQQRSASDQVVQAMAEVAEMSQAFAVGSQHTSGSASAITELAAEFGALISRFEVSGGTPPRPKRAEKIERAEKGDSDKSEKMRN
jgi:methyl-accepting chemotaxis protein